MALRRVRRDGIAARGFTLLESLVASVILGMTVIAVISAVTTSNAASFEGQKRILGAIAADDLMAELATLDYQTLKARDGLTQEPGAMQTLDGSAYPDTFWHIGRKVSVEESHIEDADLKVRILGVMVTVNATDDDGVLATLQLFVPEPVE